MTRTAGRCLWRPEADATPWNIRPDTSMLSIFRFLISAFFAGFRARNAALIGTVFVSGAMISRADALLESPPLSPARLFFTARDSGTLRREADGWILFTPSPLPRESVTIRLDLSDVHFRSYDRFMIEFDNRNAGTAIDWRLETELPKHGDVKGRHFAGNGSSDVAAKLPGLGALARFRELRLSLCHGTGEGKNARPSEALHPIRFRMRLALSGDGLDKTLYAALAAGLDHPLPNGFLPEERKAAETVRNRLRAKADALRKTADAANRPAVERLRAFDSLFALLDGGAAAIERAAFTAAAQSAATRGKFLHGTASGVDKIPRSGPFPGIVRGSVEISLARNEAEGAQIALFSAVPVEGVHASLSPLVSESGAVLPASIAPVGYIRTTPPAYVPPAEFRELAPDPILTHVRAVPLEPGCLQPFWIDVSAPSDANPGTYRGAARFRDASGRFSAEVPVTVRIRAFTLPSFRTLPVVFSSGAFSPRNNIIRCLEKDSVILRQYRNFLSSSDGDVDSLPPRVRRLWDAALGLHRLLADHNIPTQDIYSSVRNVQPDWLRAAEMSASPFFYCIGYDNAGPIVERVGAHLEPMRRVGNSGAAVLYGFDEIRASDTRAFAGMKRDFGAAKAAYPELRTMATALDGSFGEKTDTCEEVDIWVYPEDGFVGSRKSAERARARGKQVWFYPCNWPVHPSANFHLENYGSASRTLMGLFPWKYHADGVLYYATVNVDTQRRTTVLNSGWNEFTGNAEMIREGVTDVDVDIRCRTSPEARRAVVARWQNIDKDVEHPAPLRVRGEVRVERAPSGRDAECRIEVRFLYADAPKDRREDRQFVIVDPTPGGWRTIDAEIHPSGAIGSCYFALRVVGDDADVTFRNVRLERPGAPIDRRLRLARPIGNGPVFDECYSMFRSNGDGTLIYPGPDGAIPSLRLKLIRDGIDDYEYLTMLRDVANDVRSGTCTVPDREAFLREADALLDIPDDLCRRHDGYPYTGAPLLAWRKRIADLLDIAVAGE